MSGLIATPVGWAASVWCPPNLETAISGYGMDRGSFNVDACFSVFVTVAYAPDGVWEIREAKGKPGDCILMRSLTSQIVAISNYPTLFKACNNYKVKPLTVESLP
jgi:uncharacterized protein YcgI (DUF1989 family)